MTSRALFCYLAVVIASLFCISIEKGVAGSTTEVSVIAWTHTSEDNTGSSESWTTESPPNEIGETTTMFVTGSSESSTTESPTNETGDTTTMFVTGSSESWTSKSPTNETEETTTVFATTKIPALDTVDYIIIGVTCAAVAGVITLVSVVAILNRRKGGKVAIIPEAAGVQDTDEMITKTKPADDVYVEDNENPVLDPEYADQL